MENRTITVLGSDFGFEVYGTPHDLDRTADHYYVGGWGPPPVGMQLWQASAESVSRPSKWSPTAGIRHDFNQGVSDWFMLPPASSG